jgi:hypothetical protein
LSIGETWKHKWKVRAFEKLGLWCYFWTFLPMFFLESEKLKNVLIWRKLNLESE